MEGGMNNVVIATFRYPQEGEHARGFLSDAGIRSVLVTDSAANGRPRLLDASEVRVLVRAQDAERARRILDNTADVAFE
jgi:hypothetical protein